MHSVAKATIIIPLVIILIAVFLRFSHETSRSNTSTPSVLISITPHTIVPTTEDPRKVFSSLLNSQSSPLSIDLQGPLACTMTDMEQDMKLFIYAKNIYLKLKEKEVEQYFLLKGDCVYKWDSEQKEGLKTCNIGQFLTLAESLTRLPFFSSEMIFSAVPKFANSMGIKISDKNISKLLKSCKNQTVEPVFFDIPRDIQFVEQKISATPQELLK